VNEAFQLQIDAIGSIDEIEKSGVHHSAKENSIEE
jgi:hypothetical protein